MNLKCFVATAFDHEEVDEIYDKIIEPVLRELNIKSLRIDRVEHNEDIDDHIFKLIDQSHICIADLTYARPSVYYEAGYAFGSGKPVIYLARRNHLHPQKDDIYGNFRVHFDLQMKNIIDWTEPNKRLEKRLRNRVNHVIRPILNELKASSAKYDLEKRFAALSENERRRTILQKEMLILHARGYKNADPPNLPTSAFMDMRMGFSQHLRKTINKASCHIYLLPRPAVNKSVIEQIGWLWHTSTNRNQNSQGERIISLCVVPSLRNVRTAAITGLLSDWTPKTERVFTYEFWQFSHDKIPHSGIIAVIDGIRSIDDFVDRLRPIIAEFESTQYDVWTDHSL